jgi:hypothetical protein
MISPRRNLLIFILALSFGLILLLTFMAGLWGFWENAPNQCAPPPTNPPPSCQPSLSPAGVGVFAASITLVIVGAAGLVAFAWKARTGIRVS